MDEKEDYSDEELTKRLFKIMGFDTYLDIGRLITFGKYETADEAIKKLLKEKPDNHYVLLLLAILREKEGRIGSAVEAFEHSIKLKPDDAEAHFRFGALLVDGLDVGRGLKELEKAVELDSEDAVYRSALGAALHEAGQKKRGEKLLKEAIAQDPEDSVVKHNYYTFIEKGVKSQDLQDNLVRDAPDDWSALNSLGLKYMEEGKLGDAIEALRKALLLNPTNKVLENNVRLAVRNSLLFYRPKLYMIRFCEKYGMPTFYVLWIIFVFGSVRLFPPMLILIIPFVIYTWVAEPIASVFAERKFKKLMKNGR